MKRFIPIFALLFAIGASAYFIYLAQISVQKYAERQVTLGDQPMSAPSEGPASVAPASAAPDSVAPETKAAPQTRAQPTFQGGSKAFAPSDGMIFQGGSKAAPIMNPADIGRLRGTAVGTVRGAGAVDIRGTEPASLKRKPKTPSSAGPAPAPNAPPSFLGGSKFDPGTLPLPKRP